MKTGSLPSFIQLLQSESMSSIVNQDKPHADTLLIRAVHFTNDKTDASRKIIEDMISGQSGQNISEDDRLWRIFVNSADTVEAQMKSVEHIDAILAKFPKHRQALLAKIDLLSNIIKQDPSLTTPFLEACKGYYNLFVAKAFCFDDLIARLSTAGSENVQRFQQILKNDVGTEPADQIFLLKLEYHLLCRGDTAISALDFAANALRFYLDTQDQINPYPEAALLAALGLLFAAAEAKERGLVLQANMILHTASTKFKDYYPLRILLLRVQMVSAQVHLGMDTFFQLSIKNLQWETVGHLLLTRISTLHPHQHGHGEEALSPLGALDLALTISENSQRSLDKAIREGLKNESYSNVIDTVQLRNDLQRSFVRQLFTVEERKCRRALGVLVKPGLETLVTQSVDLRDVSFMPAYGTNDKRMTEFLSCGPKPAQGWVNMMRLQEYLLAYLSAELGSSDPGLVAYTYSNLSEARASVSNDIPDDLTAPERDNGLCTMILSGIVLGLSPTPNEMEESIGKVITLVQDPRSAKSLQAATVNGVEYPDWQFLHHQFVRLETFRAVASWAAVMTKKFKAEKDKSKQTMMAGIRGQVDELRSIVEAQAKVVHDQTGELKAKLGASGVLGRLVDVILGRLDDAPEQQRLLGERMQELQDEATVEEYCATLRESWEDALDGILATKIKTV